MRAPVNSFEFHTCVRTPQSKLGSTAARLKLKGIDGDPHKQWSMLLNSMQREEPYQGLTSEELFGNKKVPFGEPRDRCCMAVVSSCREMLG